MLKISLFVWVLVFFAIINQIQPLDAHFIAIVNYNKSYMSDTAIVGNFDNVNRRMRLDYTFFDGRGSESKIYSGTSYYKSQINPVNGTCTCGKYERIETGYWDLHRVMNDVMSNPQGIINQTLARQLSIVLTGSSMGETVVGILSESKSSLISLSDLDGSWKISFIKSDNLSIQIQEFVC